MEDLNPIQNENDPKKDYSLEKKAAIIFILAALALWLIKINSDEPPPKTYKINSPPAQSYSPPPVYQQLPTYNQGTGEFKKVLFFHGNGKKRSISFHLNGYEARLRYKYYSVSEYIGVFNIYVVDKYQDVFRDGGIPEVSVTSLRVNDESALQKQPGDYCLQVNAAGDWAVIVEERQ